MSATTSHNVAKPPYYAPSELQIKVTAPIAAADLRKYFENRDIQFIIDCKNSRLKGKALLTYLTNLDMPVDVMVDLTDYNEFSELLKAFLEQRSVVHCNTLAVLAGSALMHFSNVSRSMWSDKPEINNAFLERFCNENADTLAVWRVFLDSMITYMGRVIMKLEFQDNKELPIIDERDVIGHNVVRLICVPDYLRNYFAVTTLEAQAYFKQQFEEPMFAGRNLAYYFFCPTNYATELMNSDLVAAMQTKEGEILRNYVHLNMQKISEKTT